MRRTVNLHLSAVALALALAVNARDIVVDTYIKETAGGSSAKDSAVMSSDETFVAADTSEAHDTAAVRDDSIREDDNNDSPVRLSKDNIVDGNLSAINKQPPHIKPNADTIPQLSGTYWGFGLGFSGGNIPIFPLWQKSFPDSLQRFPGLSPTFGADTSGGDTGLLQYRITESPDAFNFALPFYLSLYSIDEKRVLSFTLSFFSNNKQFQSALSIGSTDTTIRKISALETLAFYSVSIEATVRQAIPPMFFSIDGLQQTLFSLTLGASPINTFTRKCEIKTEFDDGDVRMRAVADSVKRVFTDISGNGLSLSWRIGISAVKRYQSGYGAEYGLFYSGAYSGNFRSEGVRLTEDHITKRGFDLSAEEVTGGKPLSFLSNQAEFRATLMVPAKKKEVDKD